MNCSGRRKGWSGEVYKQGDNFFLVWKKSASDFFWPNVKIYWSRIAQYKHPSIQNSLSVILNANPYFKGLPFLSKGIIVKN